LLDFILDFKKTMFFTMGLLKLIVGYFVYYICAQKEEKER